MFESFVKLIRKEGYDENSPLDDAADDDGRMVIDCSGYILDLVSNDSYKLYTSYGLKNRQEIMTEIVQNELS